MCCQRGLATHRASAICLLQSLTRQTCFGLEGGGPCRTTGPIAGDLFFFADVEELLRKLYLYPPQKLARFIGLFRIMVVFLRCPYVVVEHFNTGAATVRPSEQTKRCFCTDVACLEFSVAKDSALHLAFVKRSQPVENIHFTESDSPISNRSSVQQTVPQVVEHDKHKHIASPSAAEKSSNLGASCMDACEAFVILCHLSQSTCSCIASRSSRLSFYWCPRAGGSASKVRCDLPASAEGAEDQGRFPAIRWVERVAFRWCTLPRDVRTLTFCQLVGFPLNH